MYLPVPSVVADAIVIGEVAVKVIAKFCFVVSTFGLMASYSFFQVKTKNALIGGIFE